MPLASERTKRLSFAFVAFDRGKALFRESKKNTNINRKVSMSTLWPNCTPWFVCVCISVFVCDFLVRLRACRLVCAILRFSNSLNMTETDNWSSSFADLFLRFCTFLGSSFPPTNHHGWFLSSARAGGASTSSWVTCVWTCSGDDEVAESTTS